MTDKYVFNLKMLARDYKITVDENGNFLCEDKTMQAHAINLFNQYTAGKYSYSFERTLVDFVSNIKSTWIDKPEVEPIERVEGRIY